jgi:hypothetical protein
VTETVETGAVSFTRRPQMVPADVRTEWRLAYLILILSRCRGSVATLPQLAFLNQALLTTARRRRFGAIVSGSAALDEALLKHEPAFMRAIHLGVGLGFLTIPREARVALTASGLAVASDLADANVLIDELAALSEAGTITQRLVSEILR